MNFVANVDVVRGALNGAAWLPGLLLLEGGVLSLVTDRGTEFSCSVAEVSLAKSSLSSLTVRSGDAEYKLSFIGGRAVPARARVNHIRQGCPDALIVSCQVAAVTHRYLRRIASARGVPAIRTGPYYSLVVKPGSFCLVGGGQETFVIAAFTSAEVRDGRVGKTSWIYVSYTTLFVGVRAGSTTYELPLRINGPAETALWPATERWAGERWTKIERTLRDQLQI